MKARLPGKEVCDGTACRAPWYSLETVFIPIGHDRSIFGPPWATIAIIVVCTLIQGYSSFSAPEDEVIGLLQSLDYETDPEERARLEASAEDALNKIPIFRWGYQTGTGLTSNALWSSFVHAGWLHLMGNMLFLFLAGSMLEDRWGRWRYLVFYGAGAIFATLFFNAFYDGPGTRLVGASGAVSATLGAFLFHFHKARITIWYWMMLRFTGTFEMAAYLALPLWFADQLLWAYMAGEGYGTGVAYTAHIGGFVFGFGVAAIGAQLWPRIDDYELEPELPGAVAKNLGPKLGSAEAKAAPAARPQDEARYQRCLDAIEAGDLTTFSENASRVILDFSRQDRFDDILTLYKKAVALTSNLPFTDGAFYEIAKAADRGGPASLYVTVATQLIAEHPGSRFIPAILWRVAQLQREGGREDLSVRTLQRIVSEHPEHEYGLKAKAALQG